MSDWRALFKMALRIALLLTVAAALQRFLIRWAFADEFALLEKYEGPLSPWAAHVRRRILVAIGIPILVASLGTAALFRREMRRRARPLADALLSVARGSLDEPLPPAPDPEFDRVRSAFDEMRSSLRDALARLDHTDAQRRRLFADLAHELATPTSFILGFADTVARPELFDAPGARAKLIAALELEVGRLDRLVRDVRDLAELDDPDVSVERCDEDVGEILEEVASRFETTAGRALERSIAPACVASVDRERIEQLASNLLANAVEHTPDGGAIRVSVEPRGARVVVVVSDAGPGVPDDMLPRLGERLFRADPSRERRDGGHGLGLSIVRAIVRRHGGEIAFARAELGGLSVEVCLPGATGE
jgi:signal transduction histidine kinase